MKKITRMLAMALSLVLFAMTFAACGEPVAVEDFATTAAATYGDEQIMMDEAVFFLRYEQATMESYYWTMYQQYGYANPWVAPAPGNDNATNKTMADYIKELIMQQIHQTRTLVYFAGDYGLSMDDVDTAACEETAASMYEALDEALLKVAPITQEQLTKWVEMNYLANLVAKAIKEEADTSYTEDEVNVYTVTYATFTDDTTTTTSAAAETDEQGNEEETSAAETKTGEQKAEEFLAKVNEAGSFTAAADADENVTGLTDHFLIAGDKDAEEDDDKLYEKTKDLAVGESVSFYDKATKKWYVAERTADNEESAVSSKTETVISKKKDAHFAEVIESLYSKGPSFSVTSAWENLVVSDGNKLIPETEASDEESDALNETLYVDDMDSAESIVDEINNQN